MNVKQSLISIITISVFITGCSSKQIDNTNPKKNEAIYQKTMTKVQNDVNEIMNKEYEYILDNMGEPYRTTYYINSNQINSADMLNGNIKSKDMRLIYPKNTRDTQVEESAIYIEIKDNKVSQVDTYELSNLQTEENKNANIVLNKYKDNVKIHLTQEISSDFKSYIGQDKNNIISIVGENLPKYEVYDNRDGTEVKVYLLSQENKEQDDALGICLKENKIQDIQIINKDNKNLMKKYLCK